MRIRGRENSAQRTQLEWPEREYLKRCAGTDHALTVLSSEAERRLAPSGEKRTQRTAPMCARIAVDSPLTVGSHSRIVRSLEPEAISSPEGETWLGLGSGSGLDADGLGVGSA